ncbi:hypothetical protein ERICIV_03930 [Paenibacillus larvae subsp. larvae]|uniref:Uncharacterized protein n=1 Tax=Paenibacillus larvae subsp. larvae TaxID=147375 RepID=A0A2L1UIJ4_9BACL|nr:hypothetical protein [Paenibacillus larvae]AQZ46536.1 hypothetical protein B5S25_07850 [Paenibacillus larvae subsp. pulvifaciens]AVF28253.1 hypothetical protein ERICIII_04187 [Paenibacillus larvae subsp. larvae]AVF32756.1 hypothetical protein ERICIV_03930 [Paenibacillus larvae subsp. larvae]MCY7520722.1 hypothetical protein [Paenibacillus larvae]MCY9500514.1 hypothetical protein [Paenibacillus larvae]
MRCRSHNTKLAGKEHIKVQCEYRGIDMLLLATETTVLSIGVCSPVLPSGIGITAIVGLGRLTPNIGCQY